MKAATKPISIGNKVISLFCEKSPDIISKALAARMGIITIKKEKRATSVLLFPSKRPVAIVAPDLEIPGITAKV